MSQTGVSQTGANFKRIESDVADRMRKNAANFKGVESILQCQRPEQTSRGSNQFVDVADQSKLQVNRIHLPMSQTGAKFKGME